MDSKVFKLWNVIHGIAEAVTLEGPGDPATQDCLGGSVEVLLQVINELRQEAEDRERRKA